jgi:hypothetical protein
VLGMDVVSKVEHGTEREERAKAERKEGRRRPGPRETTENGACRAWSVN